MAVTVRSTALYQSAFGGGADNTTAPAGVTSGDLLVAMFMVAKEGTSAPSTVPAGWSIAGAIAPAVGTRAGANGAAVVYTKPATGSEPTTYAWSFPATTVGCLWALIGADTTTPIDVAPSWLTGSTTAMDTSSITVTDGSCVLVGHSALNGSNAQTFTTPTGMTAGPVGRAGAYINGGFFHLPSATAGTTGSKASTVSPAPGAYPTQSGIVSIKAAATVTLRPGAFFSHF